MLLYTDDLIANLAIDTKNVPNDKIQRNALLLFTCRKDITWCKFCIRLCKNLILSVKPLSVKNAYSDVSSNSKWDDIYRKSFREILFIEFYRIIWHDITLYCLYFYYFSGSLKKNIVFFWYLMRLYISKIEMRYLNI